MAILCACTKLRVTKHVLPQYTSIHILEFFFLISIENHKICRISFLYILELLNDEKHFGRISIFQDQIKAIEAPD